jgi:thioredoxin
VGSYCPHSVFRAARQAGRSAYWDEMADLADVTDSNFEAEVLHAPGTVIVDCWAPWCGPCLALTPHLQRLADSLPPEMRLVKLDVDSQPDTTTHLRIRGLPVLIAFRGGQEVARLREAKNPTAVRRWVRALNGSE